ncbi:MAG: SpoIIE family protein phosphatase [Candidatus Eremiobacteraeota bacterium]|nr:SpoIIE family protein phosphatase [Candidatus Eremiobacteraeota bacterium]
MPSNFPDTVLSDLPVGETILPESGVGYSVPIVAQLSKLCIDTFADFCAVFLRNGGSEASAFAARSDDLYAALGTAPYDDLFIERAHQHGIATIIEEPLLDNARHIGTLVLGMAASEPLSKVERAIVTVVSSILSTAVRQAQELEHHYRVSTRLQKAMLPARLASVDGLTFDAAYRPASDEADVGGDWYDAFEVGNGVVAISVGDVTGHGLEAAVAMSEIRRAIRSAAPSTASPSALLNYVDNVMASQNIGMATAIVGLYDVATNVFRYASAGHPNPVLLSSSGRALYLPAGGLLLGLGMNKASQDWTVTLTPEAWCFLYTDGLLEYGRDVVAGEKVLRESLERLASQGKRTAEDLHHEIFNKGIHNTDDCATLALHSGASLEFKELHLRFTTSALFAAIVRESLRTFLTKFAFNGDRAFDVLTASGEAVANAIEHGENEPGSAFQLDATMTDDFLTITVESLGHWRPFTPREERGRGVPIMRACSQSFEISSTQDKTRVALRFSR